MRISGDCLSKINLSYSSLRYIRRISGGTDSLPTLPRVEMKPIFSYLIVCAK